jgi:hypothetical protein
MTRGNKRDHSASAATIDLPWWLALIAAIALAAAGARVHALRAEDDDCTATPDEPVVEDPRAVLLHAPYAR